MKQLQSVEDFVSDEFFQRWVLDADEADDIFWQRWIADHPHMASVVEEAKSIILSLNFKEDLPEEERLHQVWQRIQVLNQTQERQHSLQRVRHIQLYNIGKVVAVIMLLCTAGITFWNIWQQAPEYVTYTTYYGQIQQLTLPDNSVVTLNANSTLYYPASWSNAAREIWLQGEAFFQVSRQQLEDDPLQPAKFLVHTDQLDVEVVGTAFNVNTRREKTQVVLNQGRVNINFKNNNNTENLVMQPGEMVEYTSRDLRVTRAQVDTAVYTAWVNKKLIFEDLPLEEIAHALEDNFGYEITFADSSIRTERFTASIPTDDVELLFPMLSRAFGLDIDRKQQQIIFSYK